MRKIMNNLNILAFLVILVSFVLPSIMLKKDESAFEMIVYKEIAQSKVSVEARDIYLVKAIHDISQNNSQIQIVSSGKKVLEYGADINKDNSIEELQKLSEYHIIKNRLEDTNGISIGMIDRHFQTVDAQYTIRSVTLEKDDAQYELGIEGKTGKILEMTFSKEDLPENNSKEEILFNYIKYLGLDVIGDWKMEDEILKSEKAGLIVTLVKNEDHCILATNSSEILEYFN